MDLKTMTIIVEALQGYEELLDCARGILGQEYLFEEPNENTPMRKIFNLYTLVERFSPLYNGDDASIHKMYLILWNQELSYEERAKLILGL